MKVDWDELKRLHAAVGQSTKDNYLWSAAIEASFHAILAERSAAIPPGYALVRVEPTDKEFEALFEAYNKEYHRGDEMQDVCDRIRALRKITLTAAKGE